MKSAILKITGIIFRRDKKKLLLTFFSLLIGAFVLTVILGLIGLIKTYLKDESKSLIGGDIVIQRAFPIDYQEAKSIKELKDNGGLIAEKMETMVTFFSKEKKIAILSSLKVVSETYPLYGKLVTESGKNTLPAKNEIYAEKSFFDRMGIKKGEEIFIGEEAFIASEIIVSEPDSFGSGFSFGPRVIMSASGWEKTKIRKDESRISYYLLLRYPPQADSQIFLQKIETEFSDKGSRISTAEQGPERLMLIIDNTGKFFLTVTVLTLFLIMVNIRTNLIYLLDYFTRTIAVFRVLGMKRENILLIFLLLLIITGTAAGIGGNLAGNTLINFLKPEMEGLIKAELPEIKIITNIFSIAFFTVILCILSAASTLFRMIEIEPKMVLSRDFSGEKKKKILLRETLALFFLLTGLFLGVLFLTANPKVALVSVFSLSVIFLVFLLLIKGLINLLYKKKFSLPFVGRSIINFIKNQGIIGETAIASLALSLSCIFTISLVQHNIETNLQGRLRNDIPNLYVLDVQEKQIKYLQALFKNTLNLYPNIQGRFISIDQKKIENLPELKRPFNLTYRSELIEGEKLLAGEWHGEKQKKSVSLEKKFAERAGIGIGSEVEFSVQGIPIRATVTSFRTVEESNGLPFFFLVFSPDVLKDAPKSYFGYAYVPEEEIPTRQNQLAMLFPNIAAIPTEQIADTVREITGIVLNSVFAVAFPALFLGILLIFSLMANSARERFKDLLLFKTFGARRKMIFWLYLCESTIFIFISSVFAILVSVISSYLINERFFKFPDFVFNYDLILLIIIILLFSLTFSLYLLRKMFLRPPAVLFRSSL